MQFSKKSFYTTLNLLIIISILAACKQEQPVGSYKNNEISAENRQQFHQLNDQFFQLLKTNQPEEAKNMMSKQLIDDQATNRTMELIGLQCKKGNYRLLDEYYLKAATDDPGKLVINTTATGENAYTLKYGLSITKENYAGFWVVPKDAADQWLVTAIYGKYNYGWKLNKIDIGQYAINGKNAVELYQLAKKDYAKAYWANAAIDMTLAQRCLQPSGLWQYALENKISGFIYPALQQATLKYRFPITVNQVTTKPKIFGIVPENYDDGNFPRISYVSSINISDTLALQKENAAIRKVIGKVIPGIDQDKKYVLYAAFDMIPAKGNNARKYEFTPAK